MFQVGTARYRHAVIAGATERERFPAIRKRRLPPGGTRKGRNLQRFRPLCVLLTLARWGVAWAVPEAIYVRPLAR